MTLNEYEESYKWLRKEIRKHLLAYKRAEKTKDRKAQEKERDVLMELLGRLDSLRREIEKLIE